MMNFNSTMVRLEAQSIYFDSSTTKFQFHDGTIRSAVAFTIAMVIANFNSTMVRLEELLIRDKSINKYNFNSTMVRLEAPRPINEDDINFHFNSTMVRLEGLRFFVLLYNVSISIPRWYD